jgi:predicted Zn-dependent protease with MMP-like domain
MRLSQREFEEIVAEALDGIPEEIAENLSNVSVMVEAWPSRMTLENLGLSNRFELLGLYEGVPLTKRGTYYGEALPDRISIFQGPIEAVARSKPELREEIRKVVVHEIAHHIGIDDERLRELGY